MMQLFYFSYLIIFLSGSKKILWRNESSSFEKRTCKSCAG